VQDQLRGGRKGGRPWSERACAVAGSEVTAIKTCGTVSAADIGWAKLKHFSAQAAIAAQSSAALSPVFFPWCMQPSSSVMDADVSVILATAPPAIGTMATEMAMKAARIVRPMRITGKG
jgi:hypothetical protein